MGNLYFAVIFFYGTISYEHFPRTIILSGKQGGDSAKVKIILNKTFSSSLSTCLFVSTLIGIQSIVLKIR